VLPAELAYGALVEVLGAGAEPVLKELEVYREAEPPPNYSLDDEAVGVLREADERGWSRFHLVGYSRRWCGGARIRRPVPGSPLESCSARTCVGRSLGLESEGAGVVGQL
jgi:hypothetical protein